MSNISLQNSIIGINNSTRMLEKLNLQLQTGNRLNNSSDGSADMVIANSLLTQANGLAAGTKNANDAKGIMNIADGALMTYTDTLQLMKSKAVAAASDASSPSSRNAIQSDINKFMSSLSKIASDTQFNGIKLLNGSFSNKSFQVGSSAGQTVDITIMSAEVKKIGHLTESIGAALTAGTTSATLAVNGNLISQVVVSGTTSDGANLLAKAINDASDSSGVTATASNSKTGVSVVGGALAAGDLSINGVSIGAVNFSSADSTGSLTDAINSVSSSTGVTATINGNGSLELVSADGGNIHITEANAGAAKAGLTAGTNFGKITLSGSDGISIANGDAISGLNAVTTTNFTLSDINMTTRAGGQRAMDIIDKAIAEITSIQSDIGSATNQLTRIAAVNEVTEKNVRAAESNIRGADIASVQEQISNWTLRNQAALYSFSMAKEVQQSILSLLR